MTHPTLFDLDGPAPPHQRHSKTSLEAARKQRKGGKSERDRRRILGWLAIHSPWFDGRLWWEPCINGLTDAEIQDRLGMPGNTERPRRVELVRLGYVEGTTARRNGSTVWRVTDKGRRYLRDCER